MSEDSSQDNNFSYALHGEVHPYIQDNTRNQKQLAKQDREQMPWDQQPKESAKAYSAFLLYLDLGPHDRSHQKLAKIIYGSKGSTTRIQSWSVEHNWIERAEAWDRFMAESRKNKMETAVSKSEDILLSYLPKVTLNLAKAAAGEDSIGRAEMRAISDFMDRVGPAKQRRSQAININQNLTVKAPSLPQEVQEDISEVEDAEIIEESVNSLIPADLKDKKGG